MSSSVVAPTRMPRIGYLSPGPREVFATRTNAFTQGLKELGCIEGRNLSMEWRFAAANDDSAIPELADLAADLVQLGVDLIVTDGNTLAALAAKHATSTIPVVFAGSTGPIEAGLVDDPARPGSNVTGLSNSVVGVEGMYVQLLRDVVSNLRRILDFVVPDYPALTAAYDRTHAVAEAAGVVIERVDIRSADEMEAAFETPQVGSFASDVGRASSSAGRRTCALCGAGHSASAAEPVHGSNTCAGRFSHVLWTGPIGRPTSSGSLRRQDLRGTRPGDMPVEQPTEFELILNTATARALGVTIPPTVAALVTQTVQ